MASASRTVTADQVNLLIREGEGLTVEFKEQFTSRIAEDIVAFANVKGGTLLLGVRDDGTIRGERLVNNLKATINDVARNCKPSISVGLAQVGEVVAVVVPEGTEKPYACSSGYYRRLDGTTQKMNHDELRMMFAENDPMPFEEKTVRGFTFDDISKAKINAFTKEADIRIGRTAAPDFLRSLNVADAAKVKNAGILFFAKDVHRHIHQAQMTLLAFKGTNRLHIYDRRDVQDDLLTQFNEAVAFLKRHLNVRSEIHGVNRKDIYEIPLDVLREAVVNAIMHRDYSITGTQVSVEIYDDRVEIINPGGLPKGLSRRKLGTISIRRNAVIADLFFRLHKVERIGMGIQKMKEAMIASGLREPTFEPNEFFRAVFYRSPEFAMKEEQPGSKTNASGLVDGLVSGLVDGLVENQRRLLVLIKENPRISKSAMAKAIGISTTAIDNNLTRLKEKGILRRVGSTKGGHWEIMKNKSGMQADF
ncbi:MAG: putative DNA binding domain-containing protein [Phycisphaerales bacterium]|nr:putative DNA binding domain-containing protein [Phycisphaerales bacterium]